MRRLGRDGETEEELLSAAGRFFCEQLLQQRDVAPLLPLSPSTLPYEHLDLAVGCSRSVLIRISEVPSVGSRPWKRAAAAAGSSEEEQERASVFRTGRESRRPAGTAEEKKFGVAEAWHYLSPADIYAVPEEREQQQQQHAQEPFQRRAAAAARSIKSNTSSGNSFNTSVVLQEFVLGKERLMLPRSVTLPAALSLLVTHAALRGKEGGAAAACAAADGLHMQHLQQHVDWSSPFRISAFTS